jgi:hypothetical protein
VLQEDIASIEGEHHALNRDASWDVSLKDGGLNRWRASMPRKEWGVNIERGESRHSEDLFVKDLAITSDEEHIRLTSLKGLNERSVTRCLWLQDIYSALIA